MPLPNVRASRGLRAGKLDQRLILTRLKKDATGELSYDVHGQASGQNVIATVWASVEPLAGTEGLLHKQLSPTATHKVTVRYSTDTREVTPRDWFVWGSRRLEIAQVINPQERGHSIEMLCAETIVESTF